MFVERLTNEDIFDFLKYELNKEVPTAKLLYLSKDTFNFFKKNRKLSKRLFKTCNAPQVVLFKINFFKRSVSQDEECMSCEFECLLIFKYKFKKLKKSIILRETFTRRFIMRDFHFQFDPISRKDFLKFMCKKFGQEYLTEFKKIVEEEKRRHMESLDMHYNEIMGVVKE